MKNCCIIVIYFLTKVIISIVNAGDSNLFAILRVVVLMQRSVKL